MVESRVEAPMLQDKSAYLTVIQFDRRRLVVSWVMNVYS